jgi:CHASE1-domain containing sensor protein
MAKGQTLGERVAFVESWAEGHEKVCASRWRVLTAILLIGLSAILSLGGWGLTQVFELQREQLRELQQLRRAEVAAPR